MKLISGWSDRQRIRGHTNLQVGKSKTTWAKVIVSQPVGQDPFTGVINNPQEIQIFTLQFIRVVKCQLSSVGDLF